MTAAPVRERLVTPTFVALAAATLAFFVAAGIVLPVVAPFAREQLGADELGVGLAFASFSIAALILRPVVGWASDRFGRRPLLIGGALMTVGALALHLVVRDLVPFIVARSLLGAAEGFFFVAALSSGSDLAPESRRGEALSFLSLSLYLGVAIGPPIGEFLLGFGSFAAVWVGAVIVAAIATGLSLLTRESAPAVLAGTTDRPRAPLIHPAGLFPGLVILLGLIGMSGFLAFLPLHAREIGVGGAGLALVIYALIVVGLRIVGARLPDQVGAARLSGVALAVSAVGLTVLGLVPTPIGLYLGTAIFAGGVAFTMPALLALAVSRVVPEERGTVMGTATLFLDLAFGLGPVLLGAIAARAGFGAAFVASAVLALVASGLLLARRQTLTSTAPISRPVA